MVCSHCHTPNFRDYKYCRECGTRLDLPEPGSAAPSEQAEVEQLLQHAFAQMDQGEMEKALGTVQAALARDPESASAHSVLGLLYERKGLVTEAIHQFRVVLQLNPESAADREKLQQLLARSPERQGPVFTPVRLAVASAAAAGAITFGVGLALASGKSSSTGAKPEASYKAGSLLPMSPTPAPATPARPMARTPAPPATLAPASASRPFTSIYTPPATPSLAYQPSRPAAGYQPTPPPPRREATARRPEGLQPAVIGEVVPLSRPDLSPYPTPEKVDLNEKPGRTAQSRPQTAPRVEPLEPDTGFIKIEPVEKPAPQQPGAPAGPAPAGDNPKPSISITIAPGTR